MVVGCGLIGMLCNNTLDVFFLPTEEVHHKNGIKTDNSIENLELWQGSQPSGIRVHDALKHALKSLPEDELQALLKEIREDK